jgi:predicted small lipoprotein YifL
MEPAMMRRVTLLLGSALLLASAGCGNKGPLYLPPPAQDAAQTGDTEKTD